MLDYADMYLGDTPLSRLYRGDELLWEYEDVLVEIEGVPPLRFIGCGQDLADYKIYGSASGIGTQTANLFDFQSWANSVRSIDGGGTFTVDHDRQTCTITPNSATSYTIPWSYTESGVYLLPLKASTTYTISWKCSKASTQAMVFVYDADYIRTDYNGTHSITFTTPPGVKAVTFRLDANGSVGEPVTFSEIMLVEGGSAPAQFIPYGKQIQVTVTNGTLTETETIYIGYDYLWDDEYVSYSEQSICREADHLFDFAAWAATLSTPVSGSQVIDLDRRSIALTRTSSASGAYTTPDTVAISDVYRIYVSANTTYTLSWEADSDLGGRQFVFLNGTTERLFQANNRDTKSLTFTTAADTTFITLRFGNDVLDQTITYRRIRLDLGSTRREDLTEHALPAALPSLPASSGENSLSVAGAAWAWIKGKIREVRS